MQFKVLSINHIIMSLLKGNLSTPMHLVIQLFVTRLKINIYLFYWKVMDINFNMQISNSFFNIYF